MIAHVCNNTGWTWDYVEDHVTMARLEALQRDWKDLPPVRALVAGYLGYKPSKQNDISELRAMFPEGVIR